MELQVAFAKSSQVIVYSSSKEAQQAFCKLLKEKINHERDHPAWAQGVGRSNRPAPTNVNNSFICNVGLRADWRTCSGSVAFGVLGGFEQLQF
jgi:hypothetical protein